MALVSFGSRAGGASDYLANDISAYRQSNVNGVYASLQELTNALKPFIQEDATLPLLRPAIGSYSDTGEHDLPAEYKMVWTDGTEGFPITAYRAARSFRATVHALEATDGFKYSFNNAWAVKNEGGLRFSYICQDSMQNKDRHANDFTKTQKHLKIAGEGERGLGKSTYDCKGSSAGSLQHQQVPEAQTRVRRASTQKRSNKPLSLVELLQQSEGAKSPTETEKVEVKPTAKNAVPPPIDYNLPSWQAPPPPPLGRVAARLANDKDPPPYGGWKGVPYPPPHQPQQYQQGISAQVPPVAIPRVQSGYQTKPTPQAYQGLPQGKQHPKAQGLFSTPKPVRKEKYAGYELHFVVFNAKSRQDQLLYLPYQQEEGCSPLTRGTEQRPSELDHAGLPTASVVWEDSSRALPKTPTSARSLFAMRFTLDHIIPTLDDTTKPYVQKVLHVAEQSFANCALLLDENKLQSSDFHYRAMK
ncbi:hypothetical protein LTR91_025516 [Friedmanniomyces endolithicus]|uniref:Uncharacterized protein n=1 Tax=Friedmanniomyces endolithicus TaxID=329885 RepID=A0AAN6H269_9PEZI|nr:hypothetical protein LTR57_025219 [Friedmanniomyces endolithicus]KAK0950652.1 hypothetical protein LTR91_025516 [Friedmanniomyces endolithicus]KAK0951469.1 hypothetical protein LTS01_025243 [Friedmanniomyces endolithicus]